MKIYLLSLIIFTFIIYIFSGSENNQLLKSSTKNDIIYNHEVNTFIDSVLNQMSLRERIGQMIISSTLAENYDENSNEFKNLKRLCNEQKIGGFIFFKGTAKGYLDLSNRLQGSSDIPLLISADFERGSGMRVIDGSLFPNNMALGAANNPELTYKMGFEIAKETRAIGVHQNYSPVCDINNNPNNPIINVRSFGEDPQLVSKLSEQMIKGLQDGKVIATAKHFPGHGDTEIDSHNDLPVINFDNDRLYKIELVPFINAIEKGVMSVMIAHLSIPSLEPSPHIPSSLSKNIVNDLLIEKLNFNGLIVTDALNMKGITKYYNNDQVAIMCVEAGIDLILMNMDEEKSINAIERAVKNGKISEDRIDKSVKKILYAKKWLGLFENKFASEENFATKINTQESSTISQRIADESITLIKDTKNILPIKNINSKFLIVNLSSNTVTPNSAAFNLRINESFPNNEIINITDDIDANKIKDLKQKISGFDFIILPIYAKVMYGTGKISILPSHIGLIKELNSLSDKVIVISFGNPYILKEFSDINSYICAYGDAEVTIKAVIKSITGIIHFKGKLPVSITEDYKFGFGIEK
jgi:beta-N-acetylhexosaminidase